MAGTIDRDGILNRSAFATRQDATLGFDYVCLSNAELGFPDGTPYNNTLERAKEIGLDLCTEEDAILFKKRYVDVVLEKRFVFIIIGTEPILDTHDGLDELFVGAYKHDSIYGGYTCIYVDDPEFCFNGWDRFVFRRRKCVSAAQEGSAQAS